MARRVILVRHGDVGTEYHTRYIGSTDVPLCELGLRQAAALGPAASALRPGRVLSSPLVRAIQTAEQIDPAFEVRLSLREVDLGRWEGMAFDDIAKRDPALVDRWARWDPDFAFPEGESIAGFLERIGQVAGLLIADPADVVLAVAHGGVVRALICRLLGLDPRQYVVFHVDYASITTIDILDGRGVLAGLNDVCHLKGL